MRCNIRSRQIPSRLFSQLCPFCKAPLLEAERIGACASCFTPHHIQCWTENDARCSIFSCTGNETLVWPVKDRRISLNLFFFLILVIGLLSVSCIFYFRPFWTLPWFVPA